MSDLLNPGAVVAAASMALQSEDVDGVVSGDPQVRHAVLDDSADLAVGVWEITPGVVTDVEVDEIFVVLEGRARVDIENANGHAAATLILGPGDVTRLFAGMRTTWTVESTFRKVYFALPPTAPAAG